MFIVNFFFLLKIKWNVCVLLSVIFLHNVRLAMQVSGYILFCFVKKNHFYFVPFSFMQINEFCHFCVSFFIALLIHMTWCHIVVAENKFNQVYTGSLCVCAHAWVCVWVGVCVCARACFCVCLFSSSHSCSVHLWVCMYASLFFITNTHTHRRTHTHAHSYPLKINTK
jgi:hypothetical protein